MSAVRCFVLEDTARDRVYLRRFRSEGVCPGSMGYHTAMAEAGEEASDAPIRDATDEEKLDPRWPLACDCGERFLETDVWQRFRASLYRGVHPERGEILVTLDEAPVGALWRMTWVEGVPGWCGADGQSWACMTPGGPWQIDGPSSAGAKWERSGAAPLFTARPSIVVKNRDGSERYHGWLTEGVLTPV